MAGAAFHEAILTTQLASDTAASRTIFEAGLKQAPVLETLFTMQSQKPRRRHDFKLLDRTLRLELPRAARRRRPLALRALSTDSTDS